LRPRVASSGLWQTRLQARPGPSQATIPAGQMASYSSMSFSASSWFYRLRTFWSSSATCLRFAQGSLRGSSTSPLRSSIESMPWALAPALDCSAEQASSDSSTVSIGRFSPVLSAFVLATGRWRCTIRPGGTRASRLPCTSRSCSDIRSPIFGTIDRSCGPPNTLRASNIFTFSKTFSYLLIGIAQIGGLTLVWFSVLCTIYAWMFGSGSDEKRA